MVEANADSDDSALMTLRFSANRRSINALVTQISQRLEEAVSEAVVQKLASFKPNESQQAAPTTGTNMSKHGVQVSDHERLKATDLRTALLLGKVPEDAGLLIDTKTTAQLLNFSPRTLTRLHQLGAVPDPVRIGGKIIRWRLGVLLAWIEADCPPTKYWSYSPDSRHPKSRK